MIKKPLLNDKDVKEELIGFGGVPREIIENIVFFNYYLPILRADFEIADNFQDGISVVNTLIFAMMSDVEEQVDKIANWKNFTKSTFKFKIFKGRHFFIYEYAEEIVNIINENFRYQWESTDKNWN